MIEHLATDTNYFLVTRRFCIHCRGEKGGHNPITGEFRPCRPCKGKGYEDSWEPLYPEEAAQTKAMIDNNIETPPVRFPYPDW